MTNNQYPRGKIAADDDGQIAIVTAVVNNTVVVRFPRPVLWFGLSSHDARALGKKLTEYADRIES